MLTARAAVAAGTRRLEAAGCDTPRLDAELLVAEAIGADRSALYTRFDQEIDGSAGRLLAELLERREAREPVAYLLGRRAFRRLEIAVDRRVYIPRPETELLVEIGLELPSGARVHEVATGSGAVALALLDERPDLRVSASDASLGAVTVARQNAQRLGLELDVVVAVGLPLEARGVDLVLANLPYVREDEWTDLAPEISDHEPREALLAGSSGLDAIEALVAGVPPGIRLALEHGAGQGAGVRALLDGGETRSDLAGLDRVTLGRAPGGSASS